MQLQQPTKMTPVEGTRLIHVRHQDAEAFVVSLLEASGVSKGDAGVVARGLVQADLRGVESHGVNRISSYLTRIRNEVLNPKAEPTVTQVTPVVAQVRDPTPLHASVPARPSPTQPTSAAYCHFLLPA